MAIHKFSITSRLIIAFLCMTIAVFGFLLKLPVPLRGHDKELHTAFYFVAAAFFNILFARRNILLHGLIFLGLYLFGMAIEYAQEFSNHFFHARIHGRYDPEDLQYNLKGLVAFSVLWIPYAIVASVIQKTKASNITSKKSDMQIGFIGLGNLGMPIAENLLAEHPGMLVYNRTTEKTKPLADKGAKVCYNIKELAQACDIVFTIVSHDAAIKEITEGPDGIAANLKKGGIHISMSTILPATSNELSEVHKASGNHYIASPVAGRPEAAVAKKLHFLVSGDPTLFAVIKPFLTDAGGLSVWEYGAEPGAANTAKLCTNFMVFSTIQALAEGIGMARKSGIDEQQLVSMWTGTLLNCPLYINYGNLLLKGEYQPALFTLELALKDANLINQQAENAAAKMPLAELIKNEYEQLMKDGHGEYDATALALAVK